MRFFTEPPPDAVNPFYPCGVCSKKVGVRMRALQCDICQYWNHIKCDNIDPSYYEILKKPENEKNIRLHVVTDIKVITCKCSLSCGPLNS